MQSTQEQEVSLFLCRGVCSGQVITEVHFWLAKWGLAPAAWPSYLAGGNGFMQFSIRYPRFCFLFFTLYLTTLNLKPASCHLLLMKMPDVVRAQQSHFGLKNLIKALWDWWSGQLCTGWEKYPVSHLNCPTGTLSQCNDVCSTGSFLGEQSAVSFCVLNKQTLCGNGS